MEFDSGKRSTQRAWNNPWNNRKTEHARRKPDGGFCFIPAMALLQAWWAYKRGIIRLYDLRVWFACFELVARRCDVCPNRFPRYTKEEIHTLVGGRHVGRIQTTIRRLSNAGLLEWSDRRIRFPATKMEGEYGHDLELQRMVDLVANHRRKVPVPRRTIRFLAGLSRPVTIATVLGHLLRCLYYRNGLCEPRGRCKASWIADVFDVDVRNVKAARLNLREVGWLVVDQAPQTAMNRWGAVVTIQLTWKFSEARSPTQSPYPRPESCVQSPPPYKDKKLSSRTEDPKTARAVRAGACAQLEPNLRQVQPDDLRDPRRIDVLYEQARRRHLVQRGEAARLRFHAAAAHALRIGKQNPAGLFVAMVHRGLWSYLSGVDEDAAIRRLAMVNEPPAIRPPRDAEAASRRSAPTPANRILESVLLKLQTVVAASA